MTTRRTGSWILAAGLLLSSPPALAGIGDKTVPLLNGTTKARVIYTFTGVMNDNNELATAVHCTSTERTGGPTILVGVEFFNFNGTLQNDVTAGQGVISVAPANTVTFATQEVAAFVVDERLSSPPLNQGSGRILATSKKIVCTAQTIDSENSPPISWVSLPLFGGTKQKGD